MNVFQAAKQISCTDAARKLGLKESHGRFQCPFHDDSHPSMACYEDSRRFYCFSCHAKGDAVDLWARVQRMSLKAAAEDLCSAYGLGYQRESREDRAIKQRIDDVALLPQAVWQDWHRGMLALLEEEIGACCRVMEGFPDPEGWLWGLTIRRATALQDEMNRLKAVEAKDLAAEVAQRRARPQDYPDQPPVDEQLLREILAERLRHAGMHLTIEERGYVCRTLQISPEARAAKG